MNEGNQGSGEATGLPRLRGQPRGCRGKRMHLEGGGEPGGSQSATGAAERPRRHLRENPGSLDSPGARRELGSMTA